MRRGGDHGELRTQLIGETEKTLNALLGLLLANAELTEPQWVTLRLAGQAPPGVDLAEHVRERAHFADAPGLIEALGRRGLLADGRLSPAGAGLVAEVRERIAEVTAPIWAGLDPSDVSAAERVLSAVLGRTREVLAVV